VKEEGMSRIGIVPAVAAALVLAALAAGCGGSDSETTPAETSTVAVNERLTAEQWDSYQAASGPFTEANAAMLKKFDSCPRSGTGDTTVFAKCLGETLTTVTDTTQELTSVLAGFNGTVTGACATALDAYTNYTTPYLASITSMQQAIDSENASAFTNAYSNAKTAASGGKEERTTFETECAPA
jgi:hypothetical protein